MIFSKKKKAKQTFLQTKESKIKYLKLKKERKVWICAIEMHQIAGFKELKVYRYLKRGIISKILAKT